MDRDKITEILDRLQQKYEEEMEEVREKFEENMLWLSGICTEITKYTSQSSVLLPKTPTVKRNLRKKRMVETIPEESELDIACSSQNVAGTSTLFDTRITRSTRARSVNQSVEVNSPVLNKRSRRQASKAAGAKIKDQLNINLNSKMRQPPDNEFIAETQKIKCLSSHATEEEGELPRKSRRLEHNQLILPADEQLNTSINKAQDINNPEANNIRTNEEEIVIYSPDHVTSPVYDDCLPIQEEKQKSVTDNAPMASAAIETHDNLPGIPNEVPVQSSEGVRPSISVRVLCSHEVDLVDLVDSVTCDEPQTNETHIHSHPDTVRDIKENNKTAPKSVIVFKEGETELSSSGTENFGNEVHQSAIEQNMSDKEVPVVEVGKTGPNVTRTETSQNSICARVLNQNVSNDIPPKKWVASHLTPALQSSPTKKVVGLQNSTHLIRPHACETVRGWMTTFERLHTVREESTEQIVEPEQTRVTRTKTRAMSKAAAAAAAAAESASTSQEISISTDLPKNIHSQSIWRASRKSVAKAKRITLAKESRELDKTEEQEMSKENSMTSVAGLKYTTPHGLQYYEKYKKTPLSAHNISNTSAHSGSHGFALGTSSKGRLLIKKQASNIVVGVESFITKQTVQPALEEIQEKKEEEMKRRIEKEEEARKKREQKLKEEVEEKRRKREEKMQKVLKTREALEKQKQDAELRMQKEKEEKSRQIIQNREDKMKEHVQQKKQHAQKKAAEIEERRKQEEAARLAKLKEQEEEQRRLQAERKKEQEEAERQHMERSAVEKEAARLREQQTALMAQTQAKLMKEKQANEKTETELRAAPNRAAILDRTFNVLPSGSNSDEHNAPKKMANVDDYGIDSSGESSEDEDRPKRPIPLWARKVERLEALKKQAWVPKELIEDYFACEEKTPNLTKMFGVRCVKRTSSAVWKTPPRLSSLPKY